MSETFQVLIVCSGNTCRSPLAAAMLSSEADRRGILGDLSISSAGSSAWDGAPASEGSYLVALERSLDLSTHRARMLTSQLVRSADLILTMSEPHSRRVAELGGAEKVHTLAGYADPTMEMEAVADPFGGDVVRYRSTAGQIAELVPPILDRLERGRLE